MSEVDKAIPSKVVSKSKPKLPWISTKLRELIKAKRTAWRAFKKSPTSEAQDTFRKIPNSVTSALRRAEYTYLQSLHRDIRLSNSATSTKSFRRHVKRLSGKIKGSAIPDLLPPSNASLSAPASTDHHKAELLNECFALQCRSTDHPSSLPDLPEAVQHKPFTTLCTTPGDVYRVLSTLKPGKAQD